LSITEGFQVPAILLLDIVGKAGIDAPAQYDPGTLKEGVTIGLIVIVRVVETAHWSAEGVKV
jgi:hypothetical protein